MSINGFNIQAMLQQYLQQIGLNINALGGANNTNNTTNPNFLGGLNGTQQTQTATNDGKTPEEIQTEIDKLKKDKADNNTKIKENKEKIKQLVAEIKTELHESKELKKKEIERHKNQVDRMVENKIEEYNKANKEGGDGMTKDELEKNISSSMPKNPDLSKAIAKELVANEKLGEIEKLNAEIDKLEIENKTIDEDIKVKTDAKAKAQEAQNQAQQQAGANSAAGNANETAGVAGNTGGGGYSYEQQIADLKARADSGDSDASDLLNSNGVDYTSTAEQADQIDKGAQENSAHGNNM